MNFGQRIRGIDPAQIALISDAGAFAYSDFTASGEMRSVDANIGIATTDSYSAIQTLSNLDGSVRSFVFLSPNLKESDLKTLAERAEVDLLLVDGEREFEDVALQAKAHSQFEDIKNALTAFSESSPMETRWILTTSGTTGTPKLVDHSLESLTRTTKFDPAKGASMRWGLLYDFTRYAGLQVLLQAILGGSTLLSPSPEAKIEEKIDFFVKHQATNLSATPTLWRKIIMTPNSAELDLKNITLGGEIADDKILTILKETYPDAKIRHIYASTEAGVGFSVGDGKAGFPETYLQNNAQNIELKILDGELFVKNPLVQGKYVGDEKTFADDQNWVGTGDAVEIIDGRVHFKGRISGVINVGGDKVHPEALEQILTEHESVIGAFVYAKSNPFTGELVVADLVLADHISDASAEIERIEHALREKLPNYMMPAFMRPVDKIEETHSGKVKRS